MQSRAIVLAVLLAACAPPQTPLVEVTVTTIPTNTAQPVYPDFLPVPSPTPFRQEWVHTVAAIETGRNSRICGQVIQQYPDASLVRVYSEETGASFRREVFFDGTAHIWECIGPLAPGQYFLELRVTDSWRTETSSGATIVGPFALDVQFGFDYRFIFAAGLLRV